MSFQELIPMDRGQLEQFLGSGNDAAIIEALLSAAFYDPDWKWIQNQCLRFLEWDDNDVRCTAAVCLGHIARIHRMIESPVVVPKLTSLQDDPAVGPYAEEALDDIAHFIPPH